MSGYLALLLMLAYLRLQSDLVATVGGDLLEFSKVVGVISPKRGVVDILV